MTRTPSVAIVGAGMSGLCMAITLQRAGITDVTLYEKAGDIGGTWRDNTYPGLSCDIPSRFYQYTFATKPDWSHFFAPGNEIHEYFSRIADTYRLREKIEFGTEVVDAEFDGRRWRVRTSGGRVSTVDFLISATGILHHPRYPDIPGLDSFGGAVFHSARWNHDVELTGKRVAVLGTGSTGVQIVCGLADTAGQLELFQRSAQWVLPFPNPKYTRLAHAVQRSVPGWDRLTYRAYRKAFEFFARALVKPGWRRQAIGALCRANLRTVRDPGLRRALTPDYQPMCRRLVISGRFYRAIQKPNVHLVTGTIDHIEPRGIVTADGVLHELDVLALATGFDAHAFLRPMNLTGAGGVTLEDAWRDGPRAHLTVALPDFPNFFMLMGPHSPVGNYSLTTIAETQAEHILGWIRRWQDGQFDSVAPTRQATDAFNARMRAAMPGTVWATGCDSWYLGKDGLPELWPWTPDKHRDALAELDLADYQLSLRAPAPAERSRP